MKSSHWTLKGIVVQPIISGVIRRDFARGETSFDSQQNSSNGDRVASTQPVNTETAADDSNPSLSVTRETESIHAVANEFDVVCGSCRRSIPVDASTGGLCPRCLARLALAEDECGDSWSPGDDRATGTESGFLACAVDACAPADTDASQISWLQQSLPQFEGFSLLGRGGVGDVFRARQRSLDRDVAIKLLSIQKSAAPDFVKRFHQEAVSLGMLNHPFIESVYEFGEVSGRPYLVMELVEGVTLRDLLIRGPIEPGRAALITWLVCTALRYAHGMGIAHRDIKPENILVDEYALARHDSSYASLTTSLQGAIRVTDFGLARILEGASGATRLTCAEHVLGTPYYMAPEQRYDSENVDERADIYAVGVMFYEMLTGNLPQGRVRPPSEFAEMDRKVDQIVFRCVEFDPDNRYQSISELIRDLESIPTFSLAPRSSAGLFRTAVIAGVGVLTLCLLMAILVTGHLTSHGNAVDQSAPVSMACEQRGNRLESRRSRKCIGWCQQP